MSSTGPGQAIAAGATAGAAVTAGKNAAETAIKIASPAKMVPLLLGMASLAALFFGFGMQYFLISSGSSRQQTIDPLMKDTVSTIASVALISAIGIAIYYAMQKVTIKPYFWLFVLVMVQLVFLHIAISASLYQVEIVSR